ncbi:hypothetical protein NPIL_654201 [Nephila pilipes]|uniref:Uncharacterized protein n=1 Tax=Nephila pilipes TaxID=299642 RepID=A0A8X6NEQ5_NEPPI|nr:hypothetical protein NPIL_654201 [Nephila pilipes]
MQFWNVLSAFPFKIMKKNDGCSHLAAPEPTAAGCLRSIRPAEGEKFNTPAFPHTVSRQIPPKIEAHTHKPPITWPIYHLPTTPRVPKKTRPSERKATTERVLEAMQAKQAWYGPEIVYHSRQLVALWQMVQAHLTSWLLQLTLLGFSRRLEKNGKRTESNVPPSKNNLLSCRRSASGISSRSKKIEQKQLFSQKKPGARITTSF